MHGRKADKAFMQADKAFMQADRAANQADHVDEVLNVKFLQKGSRDFAGDVSDPASGSYRRSRTLDPGFQKNTPGSPFESRTSLDGENQHLLPKSEKPQEADSDLVPVLDEDESVFQDEFYGDMVDYNKSSTKSKKYPDLKPKEKQIKFPKSPKDAKKAIAKKLSLEDLFMPLSDAEKRDFRSGMETFVNKVFKPKNDVANDLSADQIEAITKVAKKTGLGIGAAAVVGAMIMYPEQMMKIIQTIEEVDRIDNWYDFAKFVFEQTDLEAVKKSKTLVGDFVNAVDRNSDKIINAVELIDAVAKKTGLGPDEIEQIFHIEKLVEKIDVDKDGKSESPELMKKLLKALADTGNMAQKTVEMTEALKKPPNDDFITLHQ